ncbi:glycoside hydrolase family 76 protein [uncultured Microbacterium sp.]|uniref:glycoside hydrolase family 76 protein n=1 Tax=uncultured Microbacterium sp. TaxID=191216 RepID=UPI0035CC263F
MTDAADRATWNARAAAAEYAVLGAYVRRAGPFAWSRAAHPARPGVRGAWDEASGWHFWWQAHLIDAAVDAAQHRPTPGRRRRPAVLTRGLRARNLGRWVNPFYDDIAWLGLALQRDERLTRGAAGVRRIAGRLESAIDPAVGALPWRTGSDLFNAPANGPAAILLARTGRVGVAAALADWIDETLLDPVTGLVRDGIIGAPGSWTTRTELYTYCQGVALAAQLEVALRAPHGERFLARGVALIDAIAAWCAEPGRDGVLPAAGGGDGGLFAGITCRYLAWAAGALQDHPDAHARRAAASARSLVLRGAEAAWAGRAERAGRPVFAADWRLEAHVPDVAVRPGEKTAGAVGGSATAEGDLSVQLSAWLALEAAVDLSR